MTFLRNTWYAAGFGADLTDTPVARTFLDEPVVLYRAGNGAVVAMQQHCPHRFAPLDQGKIVGDDLQCPYHALRFGPSGACTGAPSGETTPPRARVKVYPVVERYSVMWIWLGDPARADPAMIPDLAYLEDRSFGWYNISLTVEANYQLVVDNLLDLSHTEFLHPLLSSEGWSRRNRAEIAQGETWVSVENIAENDNIIEIMAQVRPDMARIGTMAQSERWEAPSIVRLVVSFSAEGERIVIPSCHFLTPETSAKTHYFVRGGHDVNVDDPAFSLAVAAGVTHVFATEDVPMIEAQQRALGDVDLMDREPAILKADAGAVRARRLLAKLIRQENAQTAATIAAE